MANVAAVAQLMETAGVPATQTASTGTAPAQSFATAMQRANDDATPATPIERKPEAKPSDSSQTADKQAEAGSDQAGAQPLSDSAQPKAQSVVAPTSLRYTPANMLAAMLNHAGAAATANTAMAATPTPAATTSLPSATAVPAASPVIVSLTAVPSPATSDTATPVPLADAPLQAAAPDAKPLAVVATPLLASTKPVVKAEPTETRSSTRPAAKQEAATKAADPTAAPVPTAAASPLLLSAMPTVPIPVADANASSAAPQPSATASAANAVAGILGKTTPATQRGTAVASQAATIQSGPAKLTPIPSGLPTETPTPTGQPNGATFQQSLAAQPAETVNASPTRAAGPVSAERPLSGPSNQPSSVPDTSLPTPTATGRPPLLSSTTPKTEVDEPISPEPAVVQPALAVLRPDGAAVTAPQPVEPGNPPLQPAVQAQAQSQPSAIHKIAGKQALPSVSPLSSATAPASQTPVPPPASSTDRKPVPYVAAATVSAATHTVAVDTSVAGAASLAIAHTPVALTALSNPTGPTLTPATAVTATASPVTTDSLPHTTLTSTPTTLEVGVASGTHGWLKIRAELNASGTVDASLTGANAAATGKLHNDLPALSSFLQDEKVALGSLNVAAPASTFGALHATAAATLEPVSAFTRSAAEGVGATGTAVASDAGASGNRAPHQQAPQSSPNVAVTREDDGVARAIVNPASTGLSALYGNTNDFGGAGALSQSGYGDGGSWLNVRV